MPYLRYPVIGFVLSLSIGTITPVGDLHGEDAESGLPEMRQRFVDAAKRFELSGGENGDAPFKLMSRPALNWSNPERATTAGAMFLWTHGGRPQAAMCMYPSSDLSFDLEFQSLSEQPLWAAAEGANVWEPDDAGVEFRALDQASAPAASLPVRLRQMRILARQFAAKLVPPNKTPIPLRLLPAPIYRYRKPDPNGELIDGAMFAFVQGTDPEVLLSIEAVRNEEQEGSWQYSLARMSMVPTQVSHQDKLVWETDWAATRQRDAPYYVITEYGND